MANLLRSRKAPKGPASRLWFYLTIAFIVGFATDAIFNGSGGCRATKTHPAAADSPVAVASAAVESGNNGADSSSATATTTATVDTAAATLATAASSGAAGGGKCSEVPGADRTALRSSDFVYAAITHCARAQLMEAHRSWRGAIPTFITVDCDEAGLKALNDKNAKYGEHYAFYRNVTEADKGMMDPSAGLGYLRAGMTPTLAHRHFTAAGQAYKWLMWGDDDTLFLMPPILKALENIDPEQPWVFSDMCGWAGEFYPRCIPCSYNETGVDAAATYAIKSCKCTVSDTEADFQKMKQRYGKQVFPWRRVGGSGYLISIGFMKAIGLDSWESCLLSEVGHSPGGDLMFSECMPKQGFRYADFGWTIAHRAKYPHRVVNQFGLYDREQFMKVITGATAGNCDEVCKAELSGGVSVHIVAKEYNPDPNGGKAASWIVNATTLYNKYAVETLGLPALTSQCS